MHDARGVGLAATQAAGLYGARTSAMTKRLHAGWSAQAKALRTWMAPSQDAAA
mgnify:CR=1 FL=1